MINHFHWAYSLIKRAILASKLQKDISKKRTKKSRYWKEWQMFARTYNSLLKARSVCCLLSIIVCNSTKVATSWVKLHQKTLLKMMQLFKDVPFSTTTLLHQWRRRCFQIKSLASKKAGGCQFDNLTLSRLDFQKWSF